SERLHSGSILECPPGVDPAHAMNCAWNWISLQNTSPDITHVVAFGGRLPMLAAPVYAAWLGVPLVTLIRGNDFDTAIFAPRRSTVLQDALRRSARVCVVSRDKASKINALYPDVCPIWIPNGIDLEYWEALPSQKHAAECWKRETVQGGRRVLGLFGHIKQKKGGLFFLEALHRSGQASRFHVLFVGDLDQEIVDWLAAHQDEIHSSCYPFMDRYELLRWYSSCDFVVIPSFYDGLPNVLLEACALGVPVLASTAGGMRDVLEDGRHGFLFGPGDSGSCGTALIGAARCSADAHKRMGHECRLLVETNLTAEIEAAKYISTLIETVPCGETSESYQDTTSFYGE